MIDALAAILAFLILVTIGPTIYNWRFHRLLCRREKALLELAEQWEALRQAEVIQIRAYRDGGSYVVSDPDGPKTAPYYYQIWRS